MVQKGYRKGTEVVKKGYRKGKEAALHTVAAPAVRAAVKTMVSSPEVTFRYCLNNAVVALFCMFFALETKLETTFRNSFPLYVIKIKTILIFFWPLLIIISLVLGLLS